MKHIKFVILGVLTSSLYASGFYGGVDIGAAFINTKSITDLSAQSFYFIPEALAPSTYIVNKKITKTKLRPGMFVGYKFNREANGGG